MDILRRTETLPGYVAILLRMEAFHRAFEPRLAELDFEPRVPRLRADLDALAPGWRPEATPSVPTFESLDHALGGLYVIEGAALGGQIIARRLLARHGLTETRGASFFASGGSPIGPRWKVVRAMLDASDDYDALEAGAIATFEAFERAVVAEAVHA